jgi:hypothetical protein
MESVKLRWPSLRVAHVGSAFTPRQYDAMVREFETTKTVPVPDEGCLSDAQLTELRVLFPGADHTAWADFHMGGC